MDGERELERDNNGVVFIDTDKWEAISCDKVGAFHLPTPPEDAPDCPTYPRHCFSLCFVFQVDPP